MSIHKMKPAFSMITAIFVIVIMAGLLALVSSLSGKIVKETTAQYRKEQAALLAKSYTEFAILAVQGSRMEPGGNNCLRTITADINSLTGPSTSLSHGTRDGKGYHVEVKIQYIGLDTAISCGNISSGHGSLGRLATSTSSDISITVDVYVQYHDLSIVDAAGGTGNTNMAWVTYHRRTLQKL